MAPFVIALKQNVSYQHYFCYHLVWYFQDRPSKVRGLSLHLLEDQFNAPSSLCFLINWVAIQYSNWLMLTYSAAYRPSMFYFNYAKQSGWFSLYQCLYAFTLEIIDEEMEIWGPQVWSSTWAKIAKLFSNMLIAVILSLGILQPLISPHSNQYLVLSVIKKILILMWGMLFDFCFYL